MKHQEHIVCVKASKAAHGENGLIEYELRLEDLMLGQRASLEKDEDFRQVLPISVFTHDGKVWIYQRTTSGGESRLHNLIAAAVGGHWDMEDIVFEGSVIDIGKSLAKAMERELAEEVKLTSKIIRSRRLPKMICSDETEVDRVHMAMIYVHELDGEGVESAEEQLRSIGFRAPEELLKGEYNLETWARIICEILINEKK
ncbi:NUDIX domain-containing protein [Microbulbifer sp. HZ11]|uniref:NUDIX domain-containing protein n=1 Tax=Microbulbifer sp. HZ11 TaxID=1453501 RepID=UPI0005BB7B25|nr:NUDIX domain-containing protein [Microbulbifer sp. HZ11]